MKYLKAKDNVKTLDRKKSNSFNGSNLDTNPKENKLKKTKSDAQITLKIVYVPPSKGDSKSSHINCEKHNMNVPILTKNYKHVPSAVITNQ